MKTLGSPLLVLVAGLLLTGYLVQWQQAQNEAMAERRFTAKVNRFAGDVERRLQSYEYGLRGARGAAVTAGEAGLNREVFSRYSRTRDADREFPGARGFGFIRRVAPENTAAFIAEARKDGWPVFDIAQLRPHTGDRYVIQYVEPVERNAAAVGLDIASDPNRLTTAKESVRLDAPAISEPLTLVQATGAVNRAFLVLLPVYRDGLPVDTPAQRNDAVWGWTYAPVVLDDVLAGLVGEEPDVRWSIYDQADDGTRQAVLSSLASAPEGGRQQAVEVPIFNRTWRVEAQSMPSFENGLAMTSPMAVGAAGTALTLLGFMAALLWTRARRRQHDALVARAQLATIVENTDQAVIGEGPDGRIMLWNKAAESMFQLRSGDALGMPLKQALSVTGLALVPLDQAPSASGTVSESFSLVSHHQPPRALMLSRSPIRSMRGETLGSATLFKDITDRQAMEAALARSNMELEQKVQQRTLALSKAEGFLQTVLDSVPSMISYWDLRGINRAANAAFLHWLDLPREHVHGRLMQDLLPDQDLQGLKADLDRAWTGLVRKTTFRALSPRTRRWRDFSGTLVPDVQGQIIKGLYFVADDVTDLLHSQQALEVSLSEQNAERIRLSSIIEGTNVGTWEWNVQTGETRFNERWAEITGHRLVDLEPLSVKTWSTLVHPEDLQRSNQQLKQHFHGNTPFYECETRMRHRDGHWVWVQNRGAVITYTPDGKPEWMFGTHQDITLRHAAEVALREAKQMAEAASSAKSVFLATMSHEIRTPLNAVLGMHRMLESTALEPKQRDLLAKADKAGHSLLDILNDVLDLAKIEAGEMALQTETFDLQQLLDELAAIYAPSASAKGITLSVEPMQQGACWMVGDRVRLRQVLANLVGNAIKFTQVGGVLLMAEVRQADSVPRLCLTVRDSGIGIAAEALKGLFDPFVQADHTTSRRFGGTGLGLSIVRTLAQMMGGTVGVESQPGKGSEFRVDLPLTEARPEAILSAQSASRGIEVGFLCPDEGLCGQLKQRLALLGWKSVNLRCEPLAAPDILLVDAALGPDIGGRVAAWRQAREACGAGATVLLVGTSEELECLKGLGLEVERTLSKPAVPSQIFNALVEGLSRSDVLQHRLLSGSHALSGHLRWLSGVRLAVVDDSDINREIAMELLRSQGATCLEFASGEAVVNWLEGRAHEIDAVLMDVQMPVVDGLQATQRIRQRPEARRLPVVALTAGALQSERDTALASGMNAFLTKPLEPVEVVKTLRRVIAESRGRLVEVAISDTEGGLPEQGCADWPAVAGIDTEIARARASGSLRLFVRLLRLMHHHYREWSAHWEQRLHAPGGQQEFLASLHKLRGSAAVLGAVGLAEVADLAETELTNAPGANPVPPLRRVSAVLEPLLLAIAAWNERAALTHPVAGQEPLITAQGIQRLQQLLQLIRGQDLDAFDTLADLKSELAQVFSDPEAQAFEASVDGLRFAEAAHCLDTALSRHPLGTH